MQTRTIEALTSDGTTLRVEVRFSSSEPWTVELVLPDQTVVSASGADLFYALREVRQQLEHNGLLLLCNGARLDVWPSGMSGQMSGGRAAYVRRRGAGSTADDLVDIFDPASPASVATVDAQWEFVRNT